MTFSNRFFALFVTTVWTGQMQMPPLTPVTVCFNARLSQLHLNYTRGLIGQPIVFDDIILNKGGAYDSRRGYFTAPFGGLYKFTVLIESFPGTVLYCKLLINGNSVGPLFGSGYGMPSFTRSVVLDLNAGDIVWVIHVSNKDCDKDKSTRTYPYFSGFLVKRN